MAEHEDGTRTVMSLSTGARVGATVALVLLVGAGYLLWSPIQLYPVDGFPIMCGTAVSPPDNDLGTAACGDINIIRRWQAAVAVKLPGHGIDDPTFLQPPRPMSAIGG